VRRAGKVAFHLVPRPTQSASGVPGGGLATVKPKAAGAGAGAAKGARGAAPAKKGAGTATARGTAAAGGGSGGVALPSPLDPFLQLLAVPHQVDIARWAARGAPRAPSRRDLLLLLFSPSSAASPSRGGVQRRHEPTIGSLTKLRGASLARLTRIIARPLRVAITPRRGLCRPRMAGWGDGTSAQPPVTDALAQPTMIPSTVMINKHDLTVHTGPNR
jgi:hypothetical protein